MSSFDDEELARRLQNEEFESQRRQEEHQQLADAELARKLAAESQSPPPQQRIRAPLSSAAVAKVTSGQTVAVRLQHPATGNQIDEAVYAHYLDRNIMMFELARSLGSYMRTRSSGKVEFSQISDDKARYHVTSTPNGTIYLENRGHKTKTNTGGTVGWNLALQPDGGLMGSAGKSPLAEWRLVAAPDIPAYDPSTSPLHQGGRGILQSSSTASSVGEVSPLNSPVNSMGRQHSGGQSSEVHVAHKKSTRGSVAADSVNEIPTVQASVDQQMRWLGSRVGQMFLQREPLLQAMYEAGTLRRVLHRPDWHSMALTWKDYSALPIPYSLGTASVLTSPMVEWFFDQGYVKCEAVIPQQILTNALRIINFWMGQEILPKVNAVGNVELTNEILTDQDVLAVLYESPLIHMVQKFLGRGNIAPCLEASISLRFPQLGDASAADPSAKGSKKSELGGRRWQIDGCNSAEEKQPYSVLIAVPLSATSQSFEGNLCVFPEAHAKTHEALVKEGHERRKSAGGTGSTVNMADELDMSKPDMGEPMQLQLAPGDAVFLPGMIMPRRDSPNYSANIRYMLYFRIAAARQTSIADLPNAGIWADFDPAIAPATQRKKNVVATEGTFSL